MKKKLAFSIPILLISALVIASSVNIGGNSQVSDSPRYHSMVEVYKNGELIEKDHNYLTEDGRDWMITQLGDVDSGPVSSASSNYIDTMTIGTGTSEDETITSVSDFDEGASQSVTWSYDSLGNMSTSVTWTASSDGVSVNATELEISGDSVVFATNTFTDTTLEESGDQVQVDYTVWVE